ncbi:hypothetical protein O0235_06280 [Tepidiforma flava]|uniref:CobQ/CobB/MinD/ParA nucleotide binding domain-containing protein n=1 Tax=Tepidiforma flava TaxID=3004094 RepID=A0ABY7M9S7_9CHLR|nr:hypothetical protein [Tepidiforma flava]WBL37170.1 hypothetical protein O0235_06280 [Tepidiforma flava]
MTALPRVVLAAPASGSGKTTAALALIAALRAAGATVQPFKTGPDYIDPSHLGAAAGIAAGAVQPRHVVPVAGAGGAGSTFVHAMAGADIAVVEGVMGMFDGRAGAGARGLDGFDLASGAGCARHPRRRCGRDGGEHRCGRARLRRIRPASDRRRRHREPGRFGAARGDPPGGAGGGGAAAAGGWLPRDPALALPERHLGLVLAGEAGLPRDALEAAGARFDLAGDHRDRPVGGAAAAGRQRLPSRAAAARPARGWAEDAAFRSHLS